MPDELRDEALAATETAASNWTGNDPATPAGVLATGAVLGRYVVLQHLDSGGMGTVYRAYDPRLEREVAIKLLRAGRRGGPEATARLLREAQALARLADPHIVAVYDADTHEDQVFIAMELVDGVTLRDWLRGERSRDQILDAVVSAGRGLAAAHRAGLVHRDFKPANAMVGTDGRVRVLDFGLARVDEGPPTATASDRGGAGDLTRTGSVMGTPRYMAPEQHRGEQAGAAADQFALCVTLYEALYGEHPFGGDSAADIATRVCAGQVRPAPPGTTVPEWMRAALLRGLAAEPADRFTSVDDLIDELTRDRDRRKRTARVVVAGVLVTALVIAALVMRRDDSTTRVAEVSPCGAVPSMLDDVWNGDARTTLQARAPRPELGREVAERLDRYADRWRTQRTDVCERRDEAYAERVQCLDGARVGLDNVREALANADPTVFEKVDPLLSTLPDLDLCDQPAGALRWEVAPADEAAAAERRHVGDRMQRGFALRATNRGKEAKVIASELEALVPTLRDPRARADAARFAAAYAGDAERVERLLRTSLAGAIASRYETGAVSAYTDLVGHLLSSRKYEAALQTAELAEAHNQRLAQFVKTWPGMEKWSALFGSRLDNLRGLVEQAQGHHEAALPYFRTAVDKVEHLAEEHPDRVANPLNNLAESLKNMGRYDEAIAAYDGVLSVLDNRRVTSRHEIISTLQNRATARLYKGEATSAEVDFRAALALADDHDMKPMILFNLASLAIMIEDTDEGARLLDRTRALWTEILPAGHPYFFVADNLACTLARTRGDLAAARAAGERAVAGLTGTLGAGHPFTAAARVELARTSLDDAKPRAAITELRAALATYAKTTGVDTADAATGQAALGRALLALGPAHRADGEAALREAIATYERMKLPAHPALVTPLLDLAAHLRSTGRGEQATALVERANQIAALPGQALAPSEAARARKMAER